MKEDGLIATIAAYLNCTQAEAIMALRNILEFNLLTNGL